MNDGKDPKPLALPDKTDEQILDILVSKICARKNGHCKTESAARDAGFFKFGDKGTEMENVVAGKSAVLDRCNKVLKAELKKTNGKVRRYGMQEWEAV